MHHRHAIAISVNSNIIQVADLTYSAADHYFEFVSGGVQPGEDVRALPHPPAPQPVLLLNLPGKLNFTSTLV